MLLYDLHVRVEVVIHVKLDALAARVGDVDDGRHDALDNPFLALSCQTVAHSTVYSDAKGLYEISGRSIASIGLPLAILCRGCKQPSAGREENAWRLTAALKS